MFGPLILLFGGDNAERLVSVASAQNLAVYLPQALYWFWSTKGPIYQVSQHALLQHQNPFKAPFSPNHAPLFHSIEEALHSQTAKEAVFILALHGQKTEDGQLQKLLESSHIAFTGSDSNASALAFHKLKAKEAVAQQGISTAPHTILSSDTGLTTLKDWLSRYPSIVVKPVESGSSEGLFIVNHHSDVSPILTQLKQHKDTAYMVEPFLEGTEVTVGVIQHGGKLLALPCTEVRKNNGFTFDYDAKYLGKGVQEITPAPISPEHTKQAQELVIAAHKAIGCFGYSRTDLIFSHQGPVFLEINTLPGLTKASFIPQQLEAAHISLSDFLNEQIQLALHRKKETA